MTNTMARVTAEVVASIVDGKGVPKELVNGTVNNGFMDVPAVFLPVKNVTANNLQDVVTAGIWTWQQVCKGTTDAPACNGKQ